MTPAEEQEAIKKLVEETGEKVWEGIRSGNASNAVEWLAKQDPELIRKAIRATQPRGWNVAIVPLEESLNTDQRVGFLAALVAVFVQTKPATQKVG